MALIDIVKYQASENEFVWKFPSEDLRIGTQVIVNFSQKAFFIKGGKVFDELDSGTHTIKSNNIPLLNKIINLPFGDESPFQAEVWFVNLINKLDNKWGTNAPILLEDPKYGIVIPVRAYGQYGFKIINPRLFLENLVGNLETFSSNKVQDFFKGKIISTLTNVISKKLILENVSILEINLFLEELSQSCIEKISIEFEKFGIELINFYFLSINIPENDPSVIKFREAKDLSATIKITGKELYQMDRSFDVLETAAKNEGGIAGNLIGAGLGFGIGGSFANQMGNLTENINTKITPPPIPVQYFVVIENEQIGPNNFDEIINLIKESKIIKSTLIWKQGMDNWLPIQEVKEFENNFTKQQFPPKNNI
jgi:membrane protease subunit (stomatin/prohibitin family)